MNHSMSSSEQQTVIDMSKDMGFLGIFGIIIGALNCLSIVGAIVGVPYIIASLRLRDAADYFKRYAAAGEANHLHAAFEKQQSAFYMLKILLIVGLILAVLGIIVAFLIIIKVMLPQMQSY